MHRGIVHVCAWSLATGAAVTLSWWGVHTVMAGTAYDPPRAVPLTGDGHTAQGVRPLASSTRRPKGSPSPSGHSGTPSIPADQRPSRSPAAPPPSKSPSGSGRPSSDSAGSYGSSGSSGNVKGYNVDGGRVVFDIGTTAAELVTATPDSGWRMQVWKQPTWIRVTFSKGTREVSVFCTWYNHAPTVELDDRG